MDYERVSADIDLDALSHNADAILARVNKRAKFLAVVKADAYGHGAVEVARLLSDRADYFGVAAVEEAVELRRAGIATPILTLGYTAPPQFPEVVENDVTIAMFCLADAEALNAVAAEQHKTAKVHIAIDTGMSRIGFQVNEDSVDEVLKISKLPNICVEGLFSHFARADEYDKTSALSQRDAYKHFVSMLSARGVEIPLKHLCNSAGIMEFDEYFDMVRAGIILYGLYPSDEVDFSALDLKPAMALRSHISHLKTLPAGRGVSYGHTFVTERDTVIATVPVGYADGYPRCLSNSGHVLIHGQVAPILGRVCMDQMMVDVSAIKGVRVGDTVVLMGKDGDNEISVEALGESAYSFNYEMVCRVARRVPRVYFKNGVRVKKVSYL